jgi:hypothetical protein
MESGGKSISAMFQILMQATAYLTFLLWIVDALVLAHKFVTRVRHKLGESAWSPESKKHFGLWTWMVFMPLAVAACVTAIMLFFLTRSIEASLGALALGEGLAVFVWLIWAIVPAIQETIGEYLKKRFGSVSGDSDGRF